LQPTTAGNKADVQSTGEVGLDFSNIKAATGATTLTNITVPNVTDVATVATVTNAVKPDWNAIANPTTAVNLSGTTIKTATDIATILSGITSLAAWLRGMFRKDAMNAAAKVEINTGGGTYNETTDSLEANRDNIGTTGAGLTTLPDVTVGAMDANVVDANALATSAVTEIVNALLAVGAGGLFPAGAIEFTYTVTALGIPVETVDIWISTDLLATNIIWRGMTDQFGVARDVLNSKPFLDPGTYYIWAQKYGFTPNSFPDTEIVS
jgi:hypothetical protein